MVDQNALPLHGPAFDADPYPAYDWLRRNDPVHPVELPGRVRVWLVTRFDDVKRALTDPRLLKNPAAANDAWRRAGLGLPLDHRPSLATHMLNTDPPHHSRLRRLVTRLFTPRRIAQLREQAQRLSDDLLDKVTSTTCDGQGSADLMTELAYPLPIAIICDLLGVPEADREFFHHWARVIDSADVAETARLGEATNALDSYIRSLMEAKLVRPGEDLLSELARRHLNGHLSRNEVTSTAFLLLISGHETTVALIGNTLLALLRHPRELVATRDDPARLPAAIEEALRYDGPVHHGTWRFAAEEMTLGGVRLAAGDPVLVSLLSANRDPARHPDAGVFLPGRADSGHLAFGHGPHFCVGAALARAETEVAVGTVLRRLPDLRLAVSEHELRWWPGTIMRGLFSLPVTFHTPGEG